MATLTSNTQRVFVDYPKDQQDQPVIASDIIFSGAAVGENGSGYARPLVAADPFLGFAIEKADNSAGAAGDIEVRMKRKGTIVLAVGSAAITDIGAAVYASDDATFTLTSTSNSYVGRITKFIATGSVEVTFDALILNA